MSYPDDKVLTLNCDPGGSSHDGGESRLSHGLVAPACLVFTPSSYLTIVLWPLQSGLCPHYPLPWVANPMSSQHSDSLQYGLAIIALR